MQLRMEERRAEVERTWARASRNEFCTSPLEEQFNYKIDDMMCTL